MKISVIIPVFNHESALHKALISIYSQTYKDIEIIVVDDGSQPPIGRIDGVMLIRQENMGAPAARNRGLQEATGECVLFWDADVTADPTCIEKMVAALKMHADASFVYTNMHFGSHRMPGKPFNRESLLHNNYIHTTSLVRRADAPMWDESLRRFQDWDYFLTMAEQGKKGFWLNEDLFVVEPRENGMSSWLPRYAYWWPLKYFPVWRKEVQMYEQAKEIVKRKHRSK